MPNIVNNLVQVQQYIQKSADKAGRSLGSITLLAVSKTKPVELIEQAFAAGQRDFGENYLQESLGKMEKLQALPIIWHYIGSIQGNKTKAIAENFSWVHTIDRLKVARSLSVYRPSDMPPLQVCLQVNVDVEEGKAGCMAEDAVMLAREVSSLPGLQLRGLMAIPKPGSTGESFKALSQLQAKINQELGLSLDTLSMGMSQDLESAICAGSTIVRVGTAIFGQRNMNIG